MKPLQDDHMQTTDEKVQTLTLRVIQSNLLPEAKLVCLDILYDRASEATIKTTQSVPHRLDVLKLIANANPKYVNNLKWEALPLIEEAIGDQHSPVPTAA